MFYQRRKSENASKLSKVPLQDTEPKQNSADGRARRNFIVVPKERFLRSRIDKVLRNTLSAVVYQIPQNKQQKTSLNPLFAQLPENSKDLYNS